MQQFIRKNRLNLILGCFIAVLFLVPNAKAFFLKGLLGTGVFNAGTKKENYSNTGVVSILFAGGDGQQFNTAALKGKVIFINFWATWCPPCVAEMGSINALYNKLKDDPRFVFILIDADSNLPQSMAFMNKHQYNLPVYQSAGAVPSTIFSGTLPTTLIIDANGVLVKKHEGIANYNTEGMVAFMKGLLQQN